VPSESDAASNPCAPAEHAARNRAMWDDYSDEYQARHGEDLTASGGLAWGTARIPESESGVLGDVIGRNVLEFGCGAAQWSIALAWLGAHPVGLDLSRRQLEHARRLMAEAGVDFPRVHASAEAVPLPAATFDVVWRIFRCLPVVSLLFRPAHVQGSRAKCGDTRTPPVRPRVRFAAEQLADCIDECNHCVYDRVVRRVTD
jgi:SAM-dependent methyltransferase